MATSLPTVYASQHVQKDKATEVYDDQESPTTTPPTSANAGDNSVRERRAVAFEIEQDIAIAPWEPWSTDTRRSRDDMDVENRRSTLWSNNRKMLEASSHERDMQSPSNTYHSRRRIDTKCAEVSNWTFKWISEYKTHSWYQWNPDEVKNASGDTSYRSLQLYYVASCGILQRAQRPQCRRDSVNLQERVSVPRTADSLPGRPALPLGAAESAISRLSPELVNWIAEMSHEAYMKMGPGGAEIPHRPWGPALVCRHWANICLRGPIRGFYSDRLYGREHIIRLRALISAPGSYLKYTVSRFWILRYCLDKNSKLIREQWLRENEPWLHLLPATRRLLPNYDLSKETGVSVEGPLPKGLKTIRSIHAYLPRTIPSSFSHGIKELSLSTITFRQFADLQHLLDELPNLQKFDGENLSWPPGPPQMTRFPRHRDTDLHHIEVSLQGHTYSFEAVAILASLCHDRSWYSSVRAVATLLTPDGPDDWSLLEVRMGSKQHMRHELKEGEHDSHPGRIICVVRGELIIPESPVDTADVIYEYRAFLPLTTLPHTPYPPGSEPAISLSTDPLVEPVDWRAFDEIITTNFHDSGIVRFTQKRPDKDIFKKEEDEWELLTSDDERFITEHLPLLSAAGSVSVTIAPEEKDEGDIN